jgi:hypothetical protein
MTGLQNENWDDIYAVRAMKEYILTGGAYAAPVTEELRAKLPRTNIGRLILREVIGLGDPEMIRLAVDRVGEGVFDRKDDVDDMLFDPLSAVSFDKIGPQHRLEVFDMLYPLSRKDDLDVPRGLIRDAMSAGDRALLQRIAEKYTEIDVNAAAFEVSFLEDAKPDMAGFWSELLGDAAFDDPRMLKMAEKAVRTQAPRTVAVLMKIGLRLKPVLDDHRLSGNPWPVRLRKRIDSHHAEMQMIAALPSMEEIFAMEKKEIQHLLAGLSPREEKALEKKRKHEAWLARRAERSQQTPEGA